MRDPADAGKGRVDSHVASVSGLHPYLSAAVYGPSKAAVLHFTQCNKDLAEQFSIRVNADLPGHGEHAVLVQNG